MSIAINGINNVVITLDTTTDVALGDWVSLSASGIGATAVSGAEPIGMCVSKNGSLIGVQIAGAMSIAHDGTLAVGYKYLKTSIAGITISTTGTPRLVVSVSADTADIIF